jgi:putative membrane protein
MITIYILNRPITLNFFWVGSLVVSMHFFGFFLMNWEVSRAFFEALTPFNLLISGFALLIFHPTWDRKFVYACLFVFLGGLTIEIIGVHTGLIFGNYEYGKTLGIKLLEVPLTIGLNWLVLLYATSSLVSKSQVSIFLKALVPAILMTALDYLIEPVAIKHDFWHWFGQAIPLKNYIGWFVSAYFLAIIFFYMDAPKKNNMAYIILLAQLFFFGMHWIW